MAVASEQMSDFPQGGTAQTGSVKGSHELLPGSGQDGGAQRPPELDCMEALFFLSFLKPTASRAVLEHATECLV